MRKESLDFLMRIMSAPSPSGYEQPVQRIVRKRMKPFADSIDTDVHGNVVVGLNPKGSPRVMLAGHADQIGLMVTHITDEGFLFFSGIGGVDPSVLPGCRVVVHAEAGPVDGVIGRKPVHLLSQSERGAQLELRQLWIDIGAKDRKDANRQVRVGDPVTFVLDVVRLGEDLMAGPAFDNKCGLWVVMEALRICAGRKLKCALFAVGTVQEEVGLRGARTSCYGVDPQVGIAVDVTHGSDYPDIDKRISGDIKLGAGPAIGRGPNINQALEELLIKTAKSKKIAHQLAAEPRATGTDANAMQLNRAGVATALVSIPNRYMHTPIEVVSRTDLTAAANLLAECVCRIGPRTNFIPK